MFSALVATLKASTPAARREAVIKAKMANSAAKWNAYYMARPLPTYSQILKADHAVHGMEPMSREDELELKAMGI